MWRFFYAPYRNLVVSVNVVTSRSVTVMHSDDISRAITRISHEIVERNPDLAEVVIVECRQVALGLLGN